MIALAHQSVQPFANVNAGGAAIAGPPMAAAGGGAPAAEDDPADPPNPPYPVRQDLRPPGTFPLPGDGEERQPPSPRREFLRDALRPAAWTGPDPDGPDRVLVSPDGANMAYTVGRVLMAGAVGAPEPVEETGPANGPPGVGAMPPGARRRGGWAMGQVQAAPPPTPPRGDHPRATLSGWSLDGNRVYWSGASGRVLTYLPSGNRVDRGTAFAEFALPTASEQVGQPPLVAVVAGQRPKLRGAPDDYTAVHILPPAGPAPTVLVPDGPARWRWPAVSPDGSRLAVISDRGAKPGQWRVFLLPLGGNEPKIEPVTPPAARVAGVCWTRDGKALVYARSQSPTPPDHAPGTPADACDLFLFDLETKKETRLSRGGGFTSPSVAKNKEGQEELYFLNHGPPVALEQMLLEKAREFAEEQEKQERERAKMWTKLVADVYAEAGTPAKGRPPLTPESVKKLADAFAKLYPAQLKDDPPGTPAALDRQRRQVSALDLAPADPRMLTVLLGAVEGEYLRRQHKGSAWHLAPEPADAAEAVRGENPFGFVFDPFDPARSAAEALFRAEGRPIVLSNDPALAKEALAKLADPDLARGTDLLKQNKGDEADRVLLGMTKRHAGNYYLIVHVGTLLQEYGRTKALAELVKPLLDQLDGQGGSLPRDARLFNLLGVALLDGEANKAVTAFVNALRCDLNYGPAYLNLAQAYQKSNRAQDARLCLRRYLKLFPQGEWAGDARRRLAAAGDDNGP
jgi:tetratricopeptide (TPR) repeat protein